MATVVKAITDKTLTTLLGASVAINGFFATRAFALLDKLDGRGQVQETMSAVNTRVDQYQDQRLVALEEWYAKVKRSKERL